MAYSGELSQTRQISHLGALGGFSSLELIISNFQDRKSTDSQ